ncbi:MAG: hypothetical protein AB1486_10030 [Planctomycetota bacterium]
MPSRARIIKKTGVPPSQGLALIREDGRPERGRGAIKVHRHGGMVTALEVTCACGRTLVIECRYEEPSKAPGALSDRGVKS